MTNRLGDFEFSPVRNWLDPTYRSDPGADMHYGEIGPIRNPKALIPRGIVALIAWRLLRKKRRR